MAPARQQFCRDTVNIFGPEDQNLHSNKASLQRPATVTKQPKVLQTDEVHPKIDSSHKLPMQKKGKRIVGEAEEPEIESENMELDTDLDSIFCNLDQPGDAIHHSYPMDIVDTEIFDEDESFVFQSVVFESESKKLIIEKRDVKNKKRKYRSEVDLANMQSVPNLWTSQSNQRCSS
jgi:hypothetical protein